MENIYKHRVLSKIGSREQSVQVSGNHQFFVDAKIQNNEFGEI